MTENESIELARAYVALSNAHRIELILPLFASNAIYSSAAVGEFEGRHNIGEMMQNFFSRYPDAFWLAQQYHFNDKRVTFEFSLQATEAATDNHLQRSGIERIEFDADGLITKLEVKVT